MKKVKIYLSSLKEKFLDAQNTNDMHKFCVFRKGMILPKQEDGFFLEREDPPLLEVTAETGLDFYKGETSPIIFIGNNK